MQVERQNQTEQNSRPNQSKNKSTQKSRQKLQNRQIMGLFFKQFSTPENNNSVRPMNRYSSKSIDIFQLDISIFNRYLCF